MRIAPGPRAVGKTPLLMLCQVQTPKSRRGETHEADVARLAESLLKFGADPCLCMGGNGRLPLSHALAHGRMRVVEVLIRYGASPYDIDENGDTPQEVARLNATAHGRANLEDAIQMFAARPRAAGPSGKRRRTTTVEDCDL